jgi:hypothetical protein
MNEFDVHRDDMDLEGTVRPLTDREVEHVLSGRPSGARPEAEALLAFIETLRSSGTGRPPRPDAALTAVFAEGLTADLPPPPAWAVPPDREPPLEARRARTRWSIRSPRILTAVNAMFGTLVGKVVFAAAIAVASIGGAHSAGVIDVPRLPDHWHAVDRANERDGAGADGHHDRGGQVPDRSPAAGPAGDHDGGTEPSGRRTRKRDADGAGDMQYGDGVDGGRVSDRATSGEPRQDGEEFGRSTADEALDGTPAEPHAGDADPGRSGQPQDRAPVREANVRAERASLDLPTAPAGANDARKGPQP